MCFYVTVKSRSIFCIIHVQTIYLFSYFIRVTVESTMTRVRKQAFHSEFERHFHKDPQLAHTNRNRNTAGSNTGRSMITYAFFFNNNTISNKQEKKMCKYFAFDRVYNCKLMNRFWQTLKRAPSSLQFEK